MKKVLYLSILLLLAAGAAEAVTYLKSDDKVIMNDGEELVGTVVFRSEKLVVVMVEGEEKRIDMAEVKKIEMAQDVTGMVERRKGDEPPKKKPEEESGEKPEEKVTPQQTPEEKPEEKEAPAEKPEEKPEGAIEPEPEAKPEPEPVEAPAAVEPKPEEKKEEPEKDAGT